MELWSPAHIKTLLPALVVMILLSIALRAWLGKKDLKIRMIPLQIIAVFLLILEVGKQAVSFSRGYALYHIPLHFCSLLLFTLPAMAFYKGKYTQQVRAIGTATCGAIFWLTALYPCLIYSAGNIEGFFSNFLDAHTVLFHNLAMLAFLLIVITIVRKLAYGDPTSGWPSLVCIISLVSGVQLFCLGIVGQYLSKTYMEVKKRPIYLVKEES